jgi:hypothetical protein
LLGAEYFFSAWRLQLGRWFFGLRSQTFNAFASFWELVSGLGGFGRALFWHPGGHVVGWQTTPGVDEDDEGPDAAG